MEKKMDIGVMWGYGMLGKRMETAILYWGYMGI